MSTASDEACDAYGQIVELEILASRLTAERDEALDELRSAHENIKRLVGEREELITLIAAARKTIERMREALEWMCELYDHANPSAFENGVTDPTGSIDEGNVIASRIYSNAKHVLAALAQAEKETRE